MEKEFSLKLSQWMGEVTGIPKRKVMFCLKKDDGYYLNYFLHGNKNLCGCSVGRALCAREQMFGEALQVVEHHSLLSSNRVALVEDLAQRVQTAAEAGVEEEEVSCSIDIGQQLSPGLDFICTL